MLRIKTIVMHVLYVFTFSSLFVPVMAADVRPFISGSGSYRAVVIEGDIGRGDFETFVRIVRENQGKISGVYIFSPGGDFYEAMKIGRALRALELSSQVPMRDPSGQPSCEDDGFTPVPNDPKNCTCASACFFVHIGGVHRGGTFLAVHRPYFGKGEFGKLSQADARKTFDALQNGARDYMQEMGVPKHIQEDVLGTPSDRALILDEKTVKTYFWLELPYRHEWTKNRCSRLSESETERVKNYSRRLDRARNASPVGQFKPDALSKTEWADLGALQQKQKEELDCGVTIDRQSRADAYEKYFGRKSTDYGNHDFAKWSEATKYLGKRFYELLSEERFEEKKFAGSSSLKRAATASAPAISLSDSDPKPKVVTRVSLVSTPNPSPEFTQRLVKTLKDAWGRTSGGNGTSEWVWDKKEFSARLVHEPVSAAGPFLWLVVKEK
jgi:hypothetical protein